MPIGVSAPAGDSISYSASGLPSGLSINASTGTIYGTIASNADASGPYSVTITATDATTSATTSETFSWTVAQAGQNAPLTLQNAPMWYLEYLQLITFAGKIRAEGLVARYQRAAATDAANIASTIGVISANGINPALSAALTGYVNDLKWDLSGLTVQRGFR